MTDTYRKTEARTFEGETFDVILKPATRPEASFNHFPPLEPSSAVNDGIRVDRDVSVSLRDGVTIYTDVYRPDGEADVPAIVAWSPYGKRTGYAPNARPVLGVPPGTLSAGAKLEGPDPDYWCRRGYAVINPDPRGVGYSEGVLQFWTRQEARDTADLIEWVAGQAWCNGRVGMSGNSWLAMSQWGAAAERPPSLACIAPWEGTTDPYRQMFHPGGVPEIGFLALFESLFVGSGPMEDIVANAARHPLHDAYWREKVADLERIEIPTYVTAGWSHFHLWGSIEAFHRIRSTAKWLRIHREFEWPDAYTPENLEDLGRFFDRYLKGHHNGWELTPPVRMDVMDRGDRDHVTRRAETAFPLPDTVHRKLFLDATSLSLVENATSATTEAAYDARSGRRIFEFTFDRDTEITGYCKLRLWVEARGADDLDLFVAVQKADKDGTEIPTLVLGHPHPGAPGILRVSHRELDGVQSTDSAPVHKHESEQRLTPGEIVQVDIPIWPTSRIWRAGERLRLVVSGHYVRDPGWFESFAWNVRNQGVHVIHTGAKFDSHLLIAETPQPRPVRPGRTITAGGFLARGA